MPTFTKHKSSTTAIYMASTTYLSLETYIKLGIWSSYSLLGITKLRSWNTRIASLENCISTQLKYWTADREEWKYLFCITLCLGLKAVKCSVMSDVASFHCCIMNHWLLITNLYKINSFTRSLIMCRSILFPIIQTHVWQRNKCKRSFLVQS